MILNRISAGRMVKETVYPETPAKPPGVRRAKKELPTTVAKELLNFKYSWQKLAFLLAANFDAGDIVGTLTFDNDHRPLNRKQAANAFCYFRKKLKAARSERGEELRVCWAIESVHRKGRYHVHFVCNGSRKDYDEIKRLWHYGKIEQLTPLLVNQKKNYISQARYMAKEQREKVGLRSWSYSHNLLKPTQTVENVPEDFHLIKPESCVCHNGKTEDSSFGRYEFQEYILKN